MVNNFKAMMVAGVLAGGSLAATHASAGFLTAGLTNISAPSVVTATDGAATTLQSSGLLIKVAGKGNGGGNGGGGNGGGGGGVTSSGGGGVTSSGGNGSSSSGAGSVPVPSPLLMILGMLGIAAVRRRKAV